MKVNWSRQHLYRVAFEKNAGFRLYQDRRSILLGGLSMTKQGIFPSDTNREHFSLILQKFFHDISGLRDSPPPAWNRTDGPLPQSLATVDFGKPGQEVIFKYVSASTWKYMQRGSFQLGSAQYYRTIENPKARDWLEGLSFISLRDHEREITAALTSGFNVALFCATREVDSETHSRMMDSFGGPGGFCLRIGPVSEFSALVAKRIKAVGVRFHDVIYSDAKSFVQASATATRIKDIVGSDSVLSNSILSAINRKCFSELYNIGLLPSLFVKPASFSHEKERRLAFERIGDLQTATLRVEDKNLLDFITIVERVGR